MFGSPADSHGTPKCGFVVCRKSLKSGNGPGPVSWENFSNATAPPPPFYRSIHPRNCRHALVLRRRFRGFLHTPVSGGFWLLYIFRKTNWVRGEWLAYTCVPNKLLRPVVGYCIQAVRHFCSDLSDPGAIPLPRRPLDSLFWRDRDLLGRKEKPTVCPVQKLKLREPLFQNWTPPDGFTLTPLESIGPQKAPTERQSLPTSFRA